MGFRRLSPGADGLRRHRGREEVWYIDENRYLVIYTTTILMPHRLVPLMHDTDFRTSVAAETNGYAQSTQPSFYIGADLPMEKATFPGRSALPDSAPDVRAGEGER